MISTRHGYTAADRELLIELQGIRLARSQARGAVDFKPEHWRDLDRFMVPSSLANRATLGYDGGEEGGSH